MYSQKMSFFRTSNDGVPSFASADNESQYRGCPISIFTENELVSIHNVLSAYELILQSVKCASQQVEVTTFLNEEISSYQELREKISSMLQS